MPHLVKIEKLFKVLMGPIVSEKSATVADQHKQVVFKVVRTATKPEIKAAVEMLFKNVKVKDVTIVNVKGKKKRFALRLGQRQDWKKAYVSLSEGDINFATAEAG
jgi:large subunit ribosomal protein L23